ncbi:MAG: hypothetical protein AB8G05_21800 [Oligoflexales bacterium]
MTHGNDLFFNIRSTILSVKILLIASLFFFNTPKLNAHFCKALGCSTHRKISSKKDVRPFVLSNSLKNNLTKRVSEHITMHLALVDELRELAQDETCIERSIEHYKSWIFHLLMYRNFNN